MSLEDLLKNTTPGPLRGSQRESRHMTDTPKAQAIRQATQEAEYAEKQAADLEHKATVQREQADRTDERAAELRATARRYREFVESLEAGT